jgi:polyisoprenoid-binding protein YceI
MKKNSLRIIALGSFVLGGFVAMLAGIAPPQVVAAHPRAAQSFANGEIHIMLDPAQSKIQWMLDSTVHTVHGTFAVKKGELRLDPSTGKASGEIVADARSGESGNSSRDSKMHKEVLESEKFPEVVFRVDHVEGKIQLSGVSTVQVHGQFVLHGAEHELTAPVQVELSADHWKGTGKFSVPFIQWGLKNPSNFLLKVKPDVEIEMELSGTLQSSPKS